GEECSALVAAVALEVPGQDARAVAEVVLDVVEVRAALAPATRPCGHDLHEAPCADEAGRIGLAHTLDPQDREDGRGVEAAAVRVLYERPRDLSGGRVGDA